MSFPKVSSGDLTVVVTVPKDRVMSLICSAFENGSYYWCRFKGINVGDYGSEDFFRQQRIPKDHIFQDTAFHAAVTYGCYVTLTEFDESGNEPDVDHRLDLAAINRGLSLFFEKCSRRAASMLEDNTDAEDGDVFLQLCLLGEIKYG